MKKISLLGLALLTTILVMAQKPVIEFVEKVHDFGTFNEQDGRVTTIFEFTNTGMVPLVITNVKASCGCTSPDWTKTPVEPGQKGTVSATYNPAGRPGKFAKTITVSSNASEADVRLTIKGEVTPKTVDKSVQYPVKIGDLGLKMNNLQFNNINKGTVSQRTIEFANLGKEEIRLAVQNPHSFLEIGLLPEVIKPNEVGKIHIAFLSDNCKQWGAINESIYLILNGVKNTSDDYKITLRANIVEDFSQMTIEQKRQAPILELNNLDAATRTIDLGIVKANSKKVDKIIISNKGVNALEIRRIANSNPELSIAPTRNSIASNKKTDLKIEVQDLKSTPGTYRRSFSIQTNDPQNANITVNVVWTIE